MLHRRGDRLEGVMGPLGLLVRDQAAEVSTAPTLGQLHLWVPVDGGVGEGKQALLVASRRWVGVGR